MRIKVWTLTTHSPEETEPLAPNVFGTYEAAFAAFNEMMIEEWEINAPVDEETGEPLRYPGDPYLANDMMMEENEGLDALSEKWGNYILTSHEVEIADPA
jgi:hypothetical protein